MIMTKILVKVFVVTSNETKQDKVNSGTSLNQF